MQPPISYDGLDGVQETNDDATTSKAHAVKMNYWTDPYIQFFMRESRRKTPEINRGYFIRTQSFQAYASHLIKKTNGNCQIINLGSGFDTLYWRLLDKGSPYPCKFVEIDLPETVQRKIYTIKTRKPLLQALANSDGAKKQKFIFMVLNGNFEYRIDSEVSMSRDILRSPPYYLLTCDLRNAQSVLSRLLDESVAVSTEKPVLFLIECVFIYMSVDCTNQLVQLLNSTFKHAAFLLYEQVNMEDKFGSIMVENFKSRECQLPGLPSCVSLQTQELRFTQNGSKFSKAWTMSDIYKTFSHETIKRIERIEPLDEREIMDQLFDHYCLVFAANSDEILHHFNVDITDSQSVDNSLVDLLSGVK